MSITVPKVKRLREAPEVVKFSSYARSGTWLAVTSILTIALTELFQGWTILSGKLLLSIGLLEVAGLCLMLLKFGLYMREATVDEILRFYRNPHYWGSALMTAGLAVFLLAPPPEMPVVPTRRVLPRVEAPRVEFPDLQVTAVVINGASSSARINGKEVWIGEGISGVTLVSVSEEEVVVELQGQRKAIPR